MTTPFRALPTSEIDAILRQLGEPQLGLVTTRQAAQAGVDKFAIEYRRHNGALVNVFAGVVRLAAAPVSANQRILAASLAVPRSLVGATSAAVAHRMPVLSSVRNDELVVIVGNSRSARTTGVHVMRCSHPVPSQPWFTTRVATPAATLMQLPRWVDSAVVERCLDHCLAERLVSVASLRALIDRWPATAVPGRRALLRLLDERTSGIGHRSGLEQTVARWLNEAGLGGWCRNFRVQIGDGRTIEVDFAWPEAKVALEISPFYTHGSRAQQERDIGRRRVLLAAGWRVVEATDPDLDSRWAFGTVVESVAPLIPRALSRSQAYQPRKLDQGLRCHSAEPDEASGEFDLTHVS